MERGGHHAQFKSNYFFYKKINCIWKMEVKKVFFNDMRNQVIHL